MKSSILCAADYGVPQIRKRLIFVGLRKEFGEFEFPQPILDSKHYVTCSDAISNLPSRENELGLEQDAYSSEPQSDYQKKCVEIAIYYITMLQPSIQKWYKKP